MTPKTPIFEQDTEAPFRLETHGDVTATAPETIEARLWLVARKAPRPVRMITATLWREPDPGLERPYVVKVSLDVDGRVVRAHRAAAEMGQALDAVEESLSRSLDDLAKRDQDERQEPGRHPAGEWRHGDLTALRPHVFPRPVEERTIVRRKSYALEPISVEEAAWEMRMLDHDFHLFTNAQSGEENVVYRGEDGVLHLQQISPSGEAFVDPVLIDATLAPTFDETAAVALLEATGGPFLFFVEKHRKRGVVVYRRYDGHFGLILPAS